MNLSILSIGSNPMPNFIVADYLRKADRDSAEQKSLPVPDKIMFVYSSDTARFKTKIVEKLGLEHEQYIDVNIEDNIRKYDYIKDAVMEKLKIISDVDSIHLNYTGGTKPMSIGISSAVEEFKNCRRKINSDLSPENFKFTLHNGEEYPAPGRQDIRSIVNISINDIYELHDLNSPSLTKKNTDCYSEDFVNFLIAEVTKKKRGNKDFYTKWRMLPLEEKAQKNRKILKNSSNKYENYSDDQLDAELENLKKTLIDQVEHFLPRGFDRNDRDNLKELKKFINGHWLEEHLFAALNKIKDDCGLTDIAWNVETIIDGRPFELDVVAMKGCECFVFTCTIDHGSALCKGKAFEGVYRSEQIGGEHAKTILVCMADDLTKEGKEPKKDDDKIVENIRKDMSQFDAAKNFYILGSKEIEDREEFIKNLKNIINGDA